MHTPAEQSGFTLIETLLYIALFVIILGAVLVATYNMIESTDKTQYRSLIHNEAQFGVRKMHWLLNGATNVSVPTADILQITNTSLSNNPITLQRSGTKLAVNLDGDLIDLTGDIAPITELSFTVAPGATPPTEVEMTMHIKNKYYDETFTAKKLLR